MTSIPSSRADLARRTLRAAGVGAASGSARSDAQLRQELATSRPLVPTAVLGGALAAGGPLLVCLAVAVVGWFLTDAGGAGAPSGALRVGAHAWLMAHGAGVSVDGIRITAIPLGLTLACAWAIARVGRRVGESISGHGPDAGRIADGARDWTVGLATGVFAIGYVVVSVVASSVAATAASAPSVPRLVLGSLALAIGVGAPAIAWGSGRAAIWLPAVPLLVRDGVVVAARMLRAWLVVCTLALVASLVLDFSTAANIVSQLHADAGGVLLIVLVTVAVVPNALLFTGSYLLGPGFTVGTGTTVTTGVVVLGPLPMFPLLAALPDQGPSPVWVSALMLSPVLVAALIAARVQRSSPVSAWETAAIRACAGGIAAGVALAVLSALAGGAVGPGRMAHVGPYAFDVLLHGIASFGIGGVLGASLMWWWQRDGDSGVRSVLQSARRRLPRRAS